jgi:multidrug transporter EmrE-like cation transporter
MSKYIPLILCGVLLNAFAQLALKQGMRLIGTFSFSFENMIPILIKVSVNPFILAGLTCYVLSVLVWLMVLSRVEVSFAYPLLSIGYVVTAFAGFLFFDENMGYIRWAGILIICLGVYLITRTG